MKGEKDTKVTLNHGMLWSYEILCICLSGNEEYVQIFE